MTGDNRMTAQKITLLDGAMGTMLQHAGLQLGDRPETLSITAPDVVEHIQRQYIQAGTRMLLANTFCANAHKLAGTGYDVEEVIGASVLNCNMINHKIIAHKTKNIVYCLRKIICFC